MSGWTYEVTRRRLKIVEQKIQVRAYGTEQAEDLARGIKDGWSDTEEVGRTEYEARELT